jgi:hypothetical protein
MAAVSDAANRVPADGPARPVRLPGCWKRGFERYNDLIDALAAGDGEVTGAATSDEPQRVAGRANGARMSLSLLRIEGLKTAVEP